MRKLYCFLLSLFDFISFGSLSQKQKIAGETKTIPLPPVSYNSQYKGMQWRKIGNFPLVNSLNSVTFFIVISHYPIPV
jgi:hypothetical protein